MMIENKDVRRIGNVGRRRSCRHRKPAIMTDSACLERPREQGVRWRVIVFSRPSLGALSRLLC